MLKKRSVEAKEFWQLWCSKVLMVSPTVGGSGISTQKEVHPDWEEQFKTYWRDLAAAANMLTANYGRSHISISHGGFNTHHVSMH